MRSPPLVSSPRWRRRADFDEVYTKISAHRSYKSLEENRLLVEPEFDRLIKAGFVRLFKSWRDVRSTYKQVAVSKLACIVKVKVDGTKQVRSVLGLR